MLVLPADVTDAASVVAAAARVHEELGPIDLAVLSAGYWKQMDPERGGRQEEQLTGGPAPGRPNPVTKAMRAVAGLITGAQIPDRSTWTVTCLPEQDPESGPNGGYGSAWMK